MATRNITRRTLSTLLRTNPSVRSTHSIAGLVRSQKDTVGSNLRAVSVVVHPAGASRHSQGCRWFSDKTAESKEEVEQEPATAESASEETAEAQTEPAEPEVSREEQLEAETKDLKNQLLRSLAEQENTRRIAQRDVQSAKDFSIRSFAKSLLDVSDNLARALEAVPEDQRADKEGQPVLANLYEGIKMTDAGLAKAFLMNGLVKYGKEGEVFDPNLHEALYEIPDPTKTPGTIGRVEKPGFMLKDRVMRPAEVGIIKKV
jgi:molecular chaperone GrpE